MLCSLLSELTSCESYITDYESIINPNRTPSAPSNIFFLYRNSERNKKTKCRRIWYTFLGTNWALGELTRQCRKSLI